jgi:plasmid stabilization system protein ParE
MNWEWRLSPSAEEEIEAQIRWYREDEARGGHGLAMRWLDLLEEALERLSASPTRHRPAPENGRWMSQYKIRQVLFRPWKSRPGWRILFVLDQPANRVMILQIRHERRRFLSDPDADV